MPASTSSASPPTWRVIAVLEATAAAADGITSSELARQCDMSTSTCALVLAELERNQYVQRDGRRRYYLAGGMLGLVHALRSRYPLLDIGRSVLEELHELTGVPCLLAAIERDASVIADVVGAIASEQRAVGQRFPLDPPYGSIPMAWSDRSMIDSWLRQVRPRLTRDEIDRHHAICADIRTRGFAAWTVDEAHPRLGDSLTAMLDAAEADDRSISAEQMSQLVHRDSLQSVTADVDALSIADFVGVPIFASNGQPSHQISLYLAGPDRRPVPSNRLEAAIKNASERLSSGRPPA